MADDATASDLLGFSVAVDNDVAIIGAVGDGLESAYFFDLTAGDQLLKLTAAHIAANDRFGWSVDITEELAIVGAWK